VLFNWKNFVYRNSAAISELDGNSEQDL